MLNDNDEKEDDLHQFISEIKSKHDINDTVNDDFNLNNVYVNNDLIKHDKGYSGVIKDENILNNNKDDNYRNIEDIINNNVT